MGAWRYAMIAGSLKVGKRELLPISWTREMEGSSFSLMLR